MPPVLAGWDPAKDRLLTGLTITAEGVKVGPCLITGKIGQGGMGAVYRARHTMLNLDVAVKILPFHLVDNNQAYVQRFQREAQAAAVVSHQNLVRVFEMGCEKDIYFLILEFVNGESAHSRLARKKRLDEGEALRIIRDASLGLGAAHQKNIIHRDVKPDNILVGADGTVKLADLGLAKIADADFAMTLSNVAMGTPQFMSPEQIKNSKTVTQASDIWAMGVSLYYLLSTQYPFEAENLLGLLNIINQATPDIAAVRPDVSLGTKTVIDRCLQKDPAQRYASTADLIADIDAALRALPTAVDLTVPVESCLASKLAPYTPMLPVEGANAASPGSDTPTLLGQPGATSSHAAPAGGTPPPATDHAFPSTLKLPKGGVPVRQQPGSNSAAAAPISTSAPTAVSDPAAITVSTGAVTVSVPTSRGRLGLIILALAILLPACAAGLYWALAIKPYNDALASAQQFEARDDFANAAAAWKSAKTLSPTPEATEGCTRTEKLAQLLDDVHKAETQRDWKTLSDSCASFLKLKPGFTEVTTLAAKAVREQRRAEFERTLHDELPKVLKSGSYDFYSVANDYKKRLDAALADFPDSRILRKAYVELALRFDKLEYLDQAILYNDADLKLPGLDTIEKGDLEEYKQRLAESRSYAYAYKFVHEPLNAAGEEAKKRFEAMAKDLENPVKVHAEMLAHFAEIEAKLPTDAEDRAKTITKAHEELESAFVRASQELAVNAVRADKLDLAIGALEPVISNIDDYYRNLAIHTLAMMKFMKQYRQYTHTPLPAFKELANDGNSKTVAPSNLPVPDLRQIRILRVLDADTVIALIDGRFYTTTLQFTTWNKITDYQFEQNTLVLSPDLSYTADLHEFVPEKGQTAPKDARFLYVYESAGKSEPWIHALVCATAPQLQFSADNRALILCGHPVDKDTPTLYSFDNTKSVNQWNFYGPGSKALKIAPDQLELYANPTWLPGGDSLLYESVRKENGKTLWTATRLSTKTGQAIALVSDELQASEAANANMYSRMLAVDPSGQYAAKYMPSINKIQIHQLTDGAVIAAISAVDMNPAKTGEGIFWSTDGKWIVYKAVDGELPVFKVVGVTRK